VEKDYFFAIAQASTQVEDFLIFGGDYVWTQALVIIGVKKGQNTGGKSIHFTFYGRLCLFNRLLQVLPSKREEEIWKTSSRTI